MQLETEMYCKLELYSQMYKLKHMTSIKSVHLLICHKFHPKVEIM